MHAAGLRVLQGTITPSTSTADASGTPEANAKRQEINTWIRTQSPADGVVDFDAAVRDPADPSRIATPYDGSDGLHFSLAGYVAMAAASRSTSFAIPSAAGPSRSRSPSSAYVPASAASCVSWSVATVIRWRVRG